MRDATAMELAIKDIFGNGLAATTFTCESAVSLATPAGFRFEVYQVIFSNTGDAALQAGIGGS